MNCLVCGEALEEHSFPLHICDSCAIKEKITYWNKDGDLINP